MRLLTTIKFVLVAVPFAALMILALSIEGLGLLCDLIGSQLQRLAKWVFQFK